MTGWAMNTEKKYHDMTWASNGLKTDTGFLSSADKDTGYMWRSTNWYNYSFQDSGMTPKSIFNNMMSGVPIGPGVRERIGNKVTCVYLKGSLTFTAACVDHIRSPNNQHGEQALPTQANYLRTTYRYAIIKDTQVNSPERDVEWQDVFENGQSIGAGVHAELKVDNMGRFIVLKEGLVQLDANDPQKTIKFFVGGNRIGNVRYASPIQGYTDKSVRMVWAAFVMGAGNVEGTNIWTSAIVGNSRFCFRDL